MMQFDPGVRVQHFTPQLGEILAAASIHGLKANKPVVVYSVNDRTHSAGSLHPFDLAVDLDVLGNNAADLAALYQHMRRAMPPTYDVVFENNHVHIEWDVKRPDALAKQ